MNKLHKTIEPSGPAPFPPFPTVISIVAQLTQLSAADCRVVEYHAARIATELEAAAAAHDEAIAERAGEIERRKLGTWTYVLQKTCCGKHACKACNGVAYKHGPYWYAYKKVDGKTHSKYVGHVILPITADGKILR